MSREPSAAAGAVSNVTSSVWPALLLVPALTLVNLSVTYALVTPSCSRQTTLALHLMTLLVACLCAAMTVSAWREWRRRVASRHRDDAAAARPAFLATVAVMCSGLSTLVVLAQWLPQWVISPCAS